MAKFVYDGSDAVFGRLASVVAKNLLKGNSVDVINCEDIIISGDKKLLVKKILAKREMGSGGSMKGPKYPRVADRLVKRMIRGMLPRDRARGREAFKRLRCYIGDENLDVLNGHDSGEPEGANKVIKLEHKKPMKFSTIKEIVRLLK